MVLHKWHNRGTRLSINGCGAAVVPVLPQKSLFLPRLANAIEVIFPSPYADYNIVSGMAPSGNR